MKKTGALFLAILFLFSNTEFHELLKVPVLISHFYAHKAETPNITVTQFFTFHYNEHEDDGDYDHDSDLPFSTTAEHIMPSLTLVISYFTLDLPAPRTNICSELPDYRTSFLSFTLLSNIWQPPKC